MTVFTLDVTLADAYGRKTRKHYETEDISGADLGAEYLAAQAFATTLMAALANLSEAEILYYNLGSETTFTDTADAGANKDEGITVQAKKLDNKLASLKVPAPVNSVIDPDGTVDLTDALVTAYFNHFLVGGGFTCSDGENIVSLVSGRLDE
jgi:hypothetical protein